MTITTGNLPPSPGTLNDAIAEAQREGIENDGIDPSKATTAELDQARQNRETTYVVLRQVSETGFEALGSYSVRGGQRAARAAALEDRPGLKEAVMKGEQVTLVALANFNPVQVGIKNRDPQLVV